MLVCQAAGEDSQHWDNKCPSAWQRRVPSQAVPEQRGGSGEEGSSLPCTKPSTSCLCPIANLENQPGRDFRGSSPDSVNRQPAGSRHSAFRDTEVMHVERNHLNDTDAWPGAEVTQD